MRAVVITQPGGPEVLELRARPEPEPGPGQVRVRIEAAGLNRADLLQRRGQYPAPPGWPGDVPGLEYAGVIDAVGPAVALRQAGDRGMGIAGGGAFAEYLVVHERETVRIPANFSSIQAASIPEAFFTAYDALVLQCGLTSGENLLIHAIGSGVGLAALQIARMLGCRTIGTSRTPAKLDAARKLGLDHGILNGSALFEEACYEATQRRGLDVVMDFLGASYLSQNLRVLAPGGRLVVVGLMAGARGELPLDLLLSRRLTIRGTTLRARPIEEKIALARSFEAHVLPMFEQGRLQPLVSRAMPMAEVVDAHRLMESNETFGKLVLVW
jgi:putative PIG3 family NAD(P)H quinone oxidoreductase